MYRDTAHFSGLNKFTALLLIVIFTLLLVNPVAAADLDDKDIIEVAPQKQLLKPVWKEQINNRNKDTRNWQITKWQEIIDPIIGKPNIVEVKSKVVEKGCGINYRDANDRWQITDTRWRQTETGFVMDKANYALEMGKTAGSSLNYRINGETLILKASKLAVYNDSETIPLRVVDEKIEGIIDSNDASKLIYKNAFGNGIHLELQALPDGFHQNVIFYEKLELPKGIDIKTAKIFLYTELGLDEYLDNSKREEHSLKLKVGMDADSLACDKTNLPSFDIKKFTDKEIEFVIDGAGHEPVVSHRFAESKVYQKDMRSQNGIAKLAIAEKQIIRNGSDNKTYLVESLDVSSLEKASYPVVWDYCNKSGTLTQDEDWYADATYYVSSTLTIDANVTLRIEPGTIVKFRRDTGYDNYINALNGTLIAKGNPYEYIVFTSACDPNMGEIIDTNAVNVSDWSGIFINFNSVIEFCKVRYGEFGIIAYTSQPGNITIKNNIVLDCYMQGIGVSAGYCAEGTVTIFNNLINNVERACIYAGYYSPELGSDVNITISNNTIKTTNIDGSCGIGITNEGDFPVQIFNNIIMGADLGIYGISSDFNEYNNAFFQCNPLISGGTASLTDINLPASPFDSSMTYLGSYFLNNDPCGGILLKNAGYGQVSDWYSDPNKWSIYTVSDANHYFGTTTTLSTDTTWQPNYSTCDTNSVAIGYHHPRVDYLLANSVSVANSKALKVKPGTVVAMKNSMTVYGKLVSEGDPFNDGYIRYLNSSLVTSNWDSLTYRLFMSPYISLYTSSCPDSIISFSGFSNLRSLYINTELSAPIHDNYFNSNCYGLFAYNTSAVLINNTFIENMIGCVKYFRTNGEITLKNCLFEKNSVNGVSAPYSSVNITNCSFIDHYTEDYNHADPNYDTALLGINQIYRLGEEVSENYNAFYHNDEHYICYVSPSDFIGDLSSSDLAGEPNDPNAGVIGGSDFYQSWSNFADRFYLPQDSNLVDAGDPCDGPMYGYTTDPDRQIIDTDRRDIGYHYLVDISNDADGLKDYQEYWQNTSPYSVDSDGDGLVDGYSGLVSKYDYSAGIDEDGDGFVDGELTLGTTPDNNDTDTDGMPDGWEHRYGLNPIDGNDASSDLDGDGKTNLQEYQAGLNPNKYSILVPADYTSIQTAINNSVNGNEVVVGQGHYYERINFNGKAITLRSSDPNDPEVVDGTVIDANLVGSAVTFNTSEDTNSIIEGLTIQRSQYAHPYASVFCDDASPTIKKCVFKDSFYGVYITGSSSTKPVIIECTSRKNCYGIEPREYVHVEIKSSRIEWNSAHGVYCVDYSNTSIVNCVILNNGDATSEAGIYVSPSSHADIINCTILNTRASTPTRGIYAYNTNTDVNIVNCILWKNGDDLSNCSATYSCISDQDSGLGNIHSNPIFVNEDVNDFHLWYSSLCIDAGDPNNVYSNEPSPNGSRINMGAYGNTSEASTATSSDDLDEDGISDSWELDNGLDPEDANDAILDMDGDGLRNIDEYYYNWDPNSDDSNRINGFVHNDQIDVNFPSITMAINLARDGDTIVVSQGHYYERINFGGKKITLRSSDPNDPNAVANTIIDANLVGSAVTFNTSEDANSVIEGFTIQRAQYAWQFASIYCNNTSPNIRKCILKNSYSGIYTTETSSKPIVEKCVSKNNYYGAFVRYSSYPFFKECIFSDNSYYGVYTSDSGTVSLQNCLIFKNANSGVYIAGSQTSIIRNCTVVNNGPNTGFGIYGYCSEIKNCILWNNFNELYYGENVVSYSCVEDQDYGIGVIHTYPIFVDEDANDYHLWYSSPCIDSNDPNDQINMGAYGNTSEATIVIDMDGDGISDQWEFANGLDHEDANDAILDMDGDGLRNIDEYYLGSDWDPNSDDSSRIYGFVHNDRIDINLPSITMAVDFAENGDVLIAEPNIYYENVSFNGKPITLSSTDPNDPNIVTATIIDANGVGNVVGFNNAEDANSILNGFTIRNSGQTTAYSGIYCYTINKDTSPKIFNCIITKNGRGISLSNGASPLISNCDIINNKYQGIYTSTGASAAEILNCRIIKNGSTGISAYENSKMSIVNSIIAKNSSGGVGLANTTELNCIINNCTIADNSSYGLYREFKEAKNCIIWNNGDDLLYSFATYSCIEDADSGLGNIHINPNFVNHDSNDYHLTSTSICIDAGEPWAEYSNEPSPNGGRVNMGAYGNTPEAAITIDNNNDGICDNWQLYHWSNFDPNDPNYGPDGDIDSDGFTNWSEYLFGYDPNVTTTVAFSIINVQPVPDKFNPAVGESLTIRYWVNLACNANIQLTDDVSSEIVKEETQTAEVGLNEIIWDGRDSNDLIVEPNMFTITVDANSSGSTDVDNSKKVELYYYHTIENLECNPYRILPLNNEVAAITYNLPYDANTIVIIYDPEGSLFGSFMIDKNDVSEFIWDGKNNLLNGKYIFKEGTYRVEVQFEGMREKESTVISVFK